MDESTATVLAALIAAIAAIVGAIIAKRANEVTAALDTRMRIRQARLDERDLISAAQGFILPLEDDAMWQEYYVRLTGLIERGEEADAARLDASREVSGQAPRLPSPRVADPLS